MTENIDILTLGQFMTNCYIIKAGENAVIIDPGDGKNELNKYLSDNGITGGYVLLTHYHADHCASAAFLKSKGFKIIIGANDAELLNRNLSEDSLGINCELFTPDKTTEDNEELDLFGIKFKVISTPGHTRGGVTYIMDNIMFTGDTLFFESIGRTDLYSGDYRTLISSVKKLLGLGDYMILPGHGPDSTVRHEKEYNPYV